MEKRPFVLSGGGCRGFAHLGVVKALQEHGIYPSEISGTSAGAIAGAFIAQGYSMDEIKEIFIRNVGLTLFAWNGFNMGLMSMKRIQAFIHNNLRYKTFEELELPLYITATNFINGKQAIFTKGDLIHPIIAASSIPALFPPTFIDGIPYVDGGVFNNLPVEPFSNRREELVCVNLNPVRPLDPTKETMMEVVDRAVHLCFRPTMERSAEGCHLFIEPQALKNYSLFDIRKIAEIFDVGYNYTKELLKKQPII
jgi:NTE family protein